MPVLSRGVVSRTFYAPAAPACCCCCLLLLKRVAHPWPLKGGVKPRQGKPSSVRLELGPSWVLVLRNALQFTVEEGPPTLQICLHGQDNRPENTAQKRLIFTSRWTTMWQHGMIHAVLNTHLPSFDSPIAMEEQRPSLQTRT